jgi:two-component system chemotaxis response regulator CheY
MKKVLIVDDSKIILRILTNLVQQVDSDIEVVTAENGEEALEQYCDTFDLIMTDWNMPVMNGLEFVNNVRKESQTPIWMITTEGQRQSVIEALRAGVNNYIVKPIDKDVFFQKVKEFLK